MYCHYLPNKNSSDLARDVDHAAPVLQAVPLAQTLLHWVKDESGVGSCGLGSAEVESSPAHIILNYRSHSIHSHYGPKLDFHLI